MIIALESIIFCFLFTILVLLISKEPIKTLYNYPPKIQERVKSLEMYKDKIPTEGNKLGTKICASILFLIIIIITLRFLNGCTNFKDAFINGYVLWSIVNLYDAIVLDIIWFCHDKRFVFEGTEDMIDEYHNYWFHLKGFLIGEVIGFIICLLSALIINFIF